MHSCHLHPHPRRNCSAGRLALATHDLLPVTPQRQTDGSPYAGWDEYEAGAGGWRVPSMHGECVLRERYSVRGETERARKSENKTPRKKEKQRDRATERQRDSEAIGGETKRQRDSETARQRDSDAERLKDSETGRETERDRETESRSDGATQSRRVGESESRRVAKGTDRTVRTEIERGQLVPPRQRRHSPQWSCKARSSSMGRTSMSSGMAPA